MKDRTSEAKPPLDAWKDGDDKPLPEDEAIEAAFPTRSGRHDLYQEAMRLVGARYSKGGLVALVTWLLQRRERAFVDGYDAGYADGRKMEATASGFEALAKWLRTTSAKPEGT